MTSAHMLAPTASGALTNAGSIAAIVAAAISALLLCWTVGRWLGTRHLARDIDHGLHVVGTLHLSGVESHIEARRLVFRAGLEFKNGLTTALSFRPTVFTVRAADVDSALVGDIAVTDIAPGQQAGWYRDPLELKWSSLPTNLTLEFEIGYGRVGRRPLRRLVGETSCPCT